jgi:hypothetical protein|nr:MAG TPA: hypothetical protein [Caudoviricetes sp.]DAQ41632.1 MAG TPA: hypothetical protein [Caudoviricetes sp.]
MATVFKAECSTNNRFYLEVNSSEMDDMVLHMEIVDRQESSVNGIELSKEDVQELIKHLQKQYAKMED